MPVTSADVAPSGDASSSNSDKDDKKHLSQSIWKELELQSPTKTAPAAAAEPNVLDFNTGSLFAGANPSDTGKSLHVSPLASNFVVPFDGQHNDFHVVLDAATIPNNNPAAVASSLDLSPTSTQPKAATLLAFDSRVTADGGATSSGSETTPLYDVAHTSSPTDSTAPPPTLDPKAVDAIVPQLHDAIGRQHGSFLFFGGGNNPDMDKIQRLLGPLTKADRQAIEKAYDDKYGKDALTNDLKKHLNSSQDAQVTAILNRDDSHTNDAGQLMVDLTKLKNGDKSGDIELREVLATLNKSQIDQLNTDFQAQYGQSFDQAIRNTPNVSDATKESLSILEKGIDQRTADDDKKLAQIAVDHQDLWLLQDALRGDSQAATQARTDLQSDSGFVQKLTDVFKDRNTAMDVLKEGHISLATIANSNNQGLWDSNKKNVELALQNATDDERRMYLEGQTLAQANQKGSTPDEQQALAFYNKTHAALEGLSSGLKPATDLNGAPPANVQQLLSDTLQMTPADLQKYKTDADYQKQIDKQVGDISDSNKQALITSLLMRDKNGEDISKLNPEEQVFYDKVSGASPQKTLLDAETALQDTTLRHFVNEQNTGSAGNSDAQARYDGPNGKQLQLMDLTLTSTIFNALSDAYEHTPNNTGGAPIPGPGGLYGLDVNGKLSPEDMVKLGFPQDLIQKRLDDNHAGQSERDSINDLINRRGVADPVEITKWEDDLLTGGSLVSQLADHHGNKDQVLSTIENMSQTDWERLHDPTVSPQFKKEIQNALQSLGVDQGTISSAMDLINQKAQSNSFADSQNDRRSILDLSSGNSDEITKGILSLRPDEQARYKDDAAFRKQVDDLVNNKLSGADKLLAQHLLQQDASSGTIQDPSHMSAEDKVLYDSVTKQDKWQTLHDVEALMADPSWRDRLKPVLLAQQFIPGVDKEPTDEERTLGQVIGNNLGDIANHSSSTQSQHTEQNLASQLLQDGKLSPYTEIDLGAPKPAIYEEIAQQPEKDRKNLIAYMHLNGDQTKVIDNIIAQNGQMDLADRIRSYTAGDDQNYQDFQGALSKLTPTQLQDLKSEYAKKYGSDLDNDFLNKVADKDKADFANLLSPTKSDGRQDYFDSLGKLLHSESGISPDGTQDTAERALQLYAEALQKYQIDGKTLPPDIQNQLNTFFGTALQQYKDSKVDFAQKLIGLGETALVFAAGIIATAASGGTLGPEALAAIGAAGTTLGAAGRLEVLKVVEGADFNGSLGNQLKQLGIGIAENGLIFIPTAAPLLATEIAGRAVEETLASDVVSKLGLSETQQAALDKALQPVVESAATQGQPLTQAQIEAQLKAAGLPADVTDKIDPAALTSQINSDLSTQQSTRLAEIADSNSQLAKSAEGQTTASESFGKLLQEQRTAVGDAIGPKVESQKALLAQAQQEIASGDVTALKATLGQINDGFGGTYQKLLDGFNGLPDNIALKKATSAVQLWSKLLDGLEKFDGSQALSPQELKDVVGNLLSAEKSGWLPAGSSQQLDQLLASYSQIGSASGDVNPEALAFQRAVDIEKQANLSYQDKYNLFQQLVKGSGGTVADLEKQEALITAAVGADDPDLPKILNQLQAEIARNESGTAVLSNEAAGATEIAGSTPSARAAQYDNIAKEMYPNDPAAQEAFKSSANKFFEDGASSKTYGLKVIKEPNGHELLVRFDPSGNPGTVKAYVQELDQTGKPIGIPGSSDQSLHLLYKVDDQGQMQLVEIKQGTAAKGNVLWQANPDPGVQVTNDWPFASSDWSNIGDLRNYLGGLVTGINYPPA